MGHHAIEVLRQGVWASLTGGWFYDPHLNLFSNTFHLYLWMFFLITPFVIKLTVHHSSQLLAWSLYCVLVAIVFIVIKIVNYKLHTLFDTTEKIAAPATDSQTNDSWPRAQSGSPSSNERIELEIIRNHSNTRDSRRTSPLENATVKAPNTGVTTVDVEAQTSAVAGASLDAASATVPTILSLDDITSMEDITSLEDLHLEELKTVAPSGTPENSPDRVKNFRRTVKAMSTQVTPQTSPLVGYKRRALSQERWPVPLIASSTPPTLKRQQPHYHSQRVTRRRNMTYRRRSKSVLDSPHGSHMLVGESRAEEQPPLTLEWAGYPHPSPRPRVRLRQMSLEEPLSGCSSRRYSFDTKPSQRERKRERRTATAKSSNVLMRTNSERLEDINVLRDSLLNNAHRRKISTVSEPADPFGESDSSDSESNEKCRPINRCQVKSSHRHIADVDTGDEHKQETSSNVLSGVLNLAREIESETMTGAGGDVKEEMAVNLTNRRTEINKGAIGDEVSSSNINACNNSEIKTDSDSDTEPAASPSDSKLKASSDSTESTNTAPPLSVVEEITELERPRNPTPTTASSARDAARAGGAIPKTGAKYEAFRERFRHVSADDTALNPHDKSTVVSSASNNSSMSGLENASLLITPKPKAKRKVEEITLANDQSSILLKRRPAVRRHTTAEDRSRVRRARYYGSGSSRASRSSSHRHSYSEAESSHTQPRLHTPPPDTEDGWHYFQDSEGCWYKYTFDSTSDGLPIKMGKDFTPGSVQGDTAAPEVDCLVDVSLGLVLETF
ncbi:pecanex-like protein 1 [Watersipora subatra]|uniref:pecanex-like protein 1 n=1 Tax=Watersipora subatra TaxID=2589382 RepID=UPI00355B8645